MRREAGALVVAALLAGAAGTALAHELDHAPPTFSEPAKLSTAVNAGGPNAQWELVTTIPTGNPQTDLDFFTVGGRTYMSVGSLAAGINSAGQNIVALTNERGEVDPKYVTGHPSATCPKATSSATGLQHDAEASPKGGALPQWPNPHTVTTDTQIVVDATDATGRCHDQGALGVAAAPQGGLEIIDVSDPAKPKEIGLTSHVGQAHTVNIDPKRPQIAFVSSSDAVNYDDKGVRSNDAHPTTPPGLTNSMDGIEVVDMSSCMGFPAGTTIAAKREACRPQVYRYRWPTVDFARSHSFRSTGACHELEIYPDDRVACAALMASVLLDLSGAFDDRGTPADYSDDRPRGTPLPCALRETSTAAEPWKTTAKVTDCVVGAGGQSLRVPDWLAMKPAPPSLEGVKKLGAAHHMGFEQQQRENFDPPYDSKTDIFVAHEAELTQSGRYMFVTDERGGGVLPVGASCSPGADNPLGNGGIHAFAVDKLGAAPPAPGSSTDKVAAYREQVYAKDGKGERAIYRAAVRTEPQGSVCTSHVFQQIPGQNRIFMGWYSQGTQVVDFVENADGSVDFKEAGWFVPENANTWTSHVFKVQQNQDGSFTYWGATGDFTLGDAGRNAIDVYKVTLPAPPRPRVLPPGTPRFPVSDVTGVEKGAQPSCARASGFSVVRARPSGRGLRFSFARTTPRPVRVELFQQALGRRILGGRRIKVFGNRGRSFTWNGKAAGLRDGYYQARFTITAPNGRLDTRRVALRRLRGRFFLLRDFDRRDTCGLVEEYRLGRPVFGGTARRALGVAFRLKEAASVAIEVRRRGKLVKRLKARGYAKGRTHSVAIRLPARARRGDYDVTLTATGAGQAAELTLRARYL